MFDIEYRGGNGLLITTKKTQVVIDPKIKKLYKEFKGEVKEEF